jgi:hypothetical protein
MELIPRLLPNPDWSMPEFPFVSMCLLLGREQKFSMPLDVKKRNQLGVKKVSCTE